MSFRLFFIGISLVVLGFVGYWLYINIPLYGLAFQSEDNWGLVASGWSIFTAGWVFVIPGTCVALAIMVPIQLWLYQFATDTDHANEIENMKQAVNTANTQAQTAMKTAKHQFESVTAEAENRTQMAITEIKKAKDMQAQAVKYARECESNMQEAIKIAHRANKKKNNARAMAERRKRKSARSESI